MVSVVIVVGLAELASDIVHVPDDVFVLLEDVMPLQLESGAQFAAGNTKVCGKDNKLLNLLGVGGGFSVGAVDALLNCAG